jgi:hypothetical protein
MWKVEAICTSLPLMDGLAKASFMPLFMAGRSK